MLVELYAHPYYTCSPIVLALREYEGRVRGFTDQLISQLNEHSGESMNASRWFNYFSFDMMGEMAFGKSFDMLKTGETVRSIPTLISGC
jgi:tryprostatin B 6-hydroxylase